MAIVITQTNVGLSAVQLKKYHDLIAVLRQSVSPTRHLCQALQTIKNEQLYRGDYDSWEAFCGDLLEEGATEKQINRFVANAKIWE